jgi:hypothetical protein
MKKQAFPETVEYRGSNATIYLQNPRNTTRYEVRFYDVDGAQQRLTFATYEAAIRSRCPCRFGPAAFAGP